MNNVGVDLLYYLCKQPETGSLESPFREIIDEYKFVVLKKQLVDEIGILYNNFLDVSPIVSMTSDVFTFNDQLLKRIIALKSNYTPDLCLKNIVIECFFSFLALDYTDKYFKNFELIVCCLMFYSSLFSKTELVYIFNVSLSLVVRNIGNMIPYDVIASLCAFASVNALESVDTFSFLCQILEFESIHEKTSSILTILGVLCVMISNMRKKIITFPYSNLVFLLSKRLITLEPVLFSALNELATFIEDESIHGLYSSIPIFIVTFVSEVTERFSLSESTDLVNCRIESSRAPHQPVFGMSSLEINFNYFEHDSMQYESTITFCDIFGIDTYRKLSSILNGCSKILDCYKRVFLDSLFESISSLSPCLSVSLLCLSFEKLLPYGFGKSSLDMIMSSTLFDPSATMFYHNNFQPVNSFLRSKFIGLLLSPALSHLFTSYLEDLSIYPFLYSELTHYIIPQMNSIKSEHFFDEKLFKSIYTSQYYLSKINEDVEERFRKIVSHALYQLFVFNFSIISYSSIPLVIYSSPFFISTFINTIMAPTFKTMMLLKIKKLFHLSNSDSEIKFGIEFIDRTLGILLVSQESEIISHISLEVLNCLLDAMLINPNIVFHSYQIVRWVKKLLIKYPNQQIIYQSLLFFTHMLPSIKKMPFSRKFLLKLRQNIIFSEGAVISDTLSQRLLSIITGKTVPSNSYLVHLKNSEMLLFLLSIFTYYKRHVEIFRVLDQISQHSYYNKMKLHNVGIDSCILDIIYHFPDSFHFRGFLIQNFEDQDKVLPAIIPLLTQLLCTKSSISVAEKIMKVLIPRENTMISKLAGDFSGMIISLISRIPERVKYFFPLCMNKECYMIKNIEHGGLFSNISHIFWLNIDETLYHKCDPKISVFRCLFDEVLYFDVFLSGLAIQCTIFQTSKHSTFTICPQIVFGKWFLVFFSFSLNQDMKLEIVSQANDSNSYSSCIEMEQIKPQEISLIYGGNKDMYMERDELLTACQLGPFASFSTLLSSTQVSDMYRAGIMKPWSHEKLEFSFPQSSLKQNSKLVPLSPFDTFFSSSSNIFEVFQYLYPIQIICPVFKFLCFMPTSCPQLFVDILGNIYRSVMHHIFPLLPFLLIQNSSSLFTYAFYLRFVSLIDLCIDQDAIVSLVINVLFSFNIWIRGSSINVHRVFQHWGNTLFNDMSFLYQTDMFLSNLLNNAIKYLSKDTKCLNFDRDVDINLELCKSCIERVIHHYSSLNFISNNVMELFSVIESCNDPEMIQWILQIAFDIISPPFFQETIKYLNTFNINKIPASMSLFIKLVFKVCEKYSFKFIHSYVFSKEIHQEIFLGFEEVSLYPLIYPLAIKLSLMKDKNYQLGLSQALINNALCESIYKEIHQVAEWPFWPVLFCLLCDEMSAQNMLNFLIRIVIGCHNQIESIQIVLSFFDICGMVSGFCPYKPKILFLAGIIPVCHKDLSSKIIDIGFDTMFFLPSKCDLFNTWIKDSFPSQFPKLDVNSSRFLYSSIHDLFNSLNIVFFLPSKPCFDGHIVFVDNLQILADSPSLRKVFLKYKIFYQFFLEQDPKKSSIVIHDNNITLISNIIANQKKRINDIVCGLTKEITDLGDSDYTKAIKSNDIILDFNYSSLWDIIQRDHMHFRSIWGTVYPTETIWKMSFSLSNSFIMNRMKRSNGKLIRSFIQKDDPPPSLSNFFCKKIRIDQTIPCVISISRKKFILHFNHKERNVSYSQIRHIIRKGKTKIEFIMLSGRTLLLDFSPMKAKDIMSRFSLVKIPNLVFFVNEKCSKFSRRIGLFKKWMSGDICTFYYITLINLFSNRSFNDPENYPIFPRLESCDNIQFLRPITFEQLVVRLSNIMPFHYVKNEYYTNTIPSYEFESIQQEICFGESQGLSITESSTAFENQYKIRHLFEIIDKELLLQWIEMHFGFCDSDLEIEIDTNLEKSQGHINSEATWQRFNEPLNEISDIEYSLIENSKAQFKMVMNNNDYARIFRSKIWISIPATYAKKIHFVDIDNTLKLFCISKNEFILYSINTEDLTLFVNRIMEISSLGTHFCFMYNSALIFDSHALDVIVLSTEDTKQLFSIPEFETISIDAPFIGLVSYGGFVNIYRFPCFSEPYYKIKVYYDTISALTISSSHCIAACGTYDGYINVFNLRDSRFVNSFFVGISPINNIVITKEMGYILVFNDESISLLSVNCIFIKTITIHHTIRFICSWSSNNGIDYIFVVDSKNMAYSFEAFYPDKRRYICTFFDGVSDISYEPIIDSICILTKKKKMLVIPSIQCL